MIEHDFLQLIPVILLNHVNLVNCPIPLFRLTYPFSA